MYCLEVIRKMNEESQKQVITQKNKFKFDKTAGYLVYSPSTVNNFKKKSVTQQ